MDSSPRKHTEVVLDPSVTRPLPKARARWRPSRIPDEAVRDAAKGWMDALRCREQGVSMMAFALDASGGVFLTDGECRALIELLRGARADGLLDRPLVSVREKIERASIQRDLARNGA